MLTLRKHRISRLEEFSDAVFGFALTFLIITGNVPRSYTELSLLLQGIPAFACCFALMGPGHWGFGRWAARRRQARLTQLTSAKAPVAT